MRTLSRFVAATFLAVCALSITAFGQANIFLELPGIQGESKQVNHAGDIDLTSFQFGIAQSGIRAAGSGKPSAARSNFSTISVTKRTDISSPDLFLSSALGKTFETATISFQRSFQDARIDYLIIKLTDVVISSYSISSGGDQPFESITLSYSSIVYTYRPINPNGSVGSPITVSFDLQKNKILPQ